VAGGRGDVTPVRVAVAGLGYWGPNLVRVLHEFDCAEVVAVCDPNPAALKKVVRRYPAIRQASDYGELLADRSIDAVVIVTPIGTHFELARAGLEAGKHVFVEKPMAGSVAEAQALIAIAEERALTLMPGHTFLYSPPVNAVRDLIQTGELGEIYFVSTSRVNLGLHQSDASVIWDLGPHDFSILRYWLDETPSRVSATTRSCIMPRVPDVAFVNLQYASGTVAHVELSWLAPSKLRRTAVVGSQKMVVYDDTSNEPVRVFDSGVNVPDPADFGEYRLSYRTGSILSPAIEATEPIALELDDFCQSIRGGRQPRSSAALGADVISVVEAAERSVGLEGSTVAVERHVRLDASVHERGRV
jgi:predicted dehydrogenase